jgi:hypothetical protein
MKPLKILIPVTFFLLGILCPYPCFSITDPQVAEFLKGMDKYYYSLSREGLSSLQADVNCDVSMDGAPAEAGEDAFKFHFSIFPIWEKGPFR